MSAPQARQGNAWGDDLSDERKAEREERLQEWAQETAHGDLTGPCDKRARRFKLTGADVFALAIRSVAGPEGDITEFRGRL
jgi:hypothetical protein